MNFMHAFILTIAVSLLAAPSSTAQDEAQQPGGDWVNVIVILADDLGVEAVSTYGGEQPTPNLDAMAADGVVFANGFAAPLCTPSRVRLLTGQYNYRNSRAFAYLDPGARTLAHVFRDAGYVTGVVGKWQLNGRDELEGQGADPSDAGFDENLVWQLRRSDRGSRYWEPRLSQLNDDGQVQVLNYSRDQYGPDILNDFATDFIRRHQTKPFFLYYSMVLPHSPFVPTPAEPDAPVGWRSFAAMVRYGDVMLGNVLNVLEELDLTERTLVVFVADNGTHRDMVSLRDGELVYGGKGNTTQAGMHVPFVIQWPGGAPSGVVVSGLADILDVFPTVVDATGVDPAHAMDGVSLLPLMRAETDSVRNWVFFDYDASRPEYPPARYVFDERYKLYDDGRFYDHIADPEETSPLPAGELGSPAQSARTRLSAVLAARALDRDGLPSPEPNAGSPHIAP